MFDTIHVFVNFPKLALGAVTALCLFTAVHVSIMRSKVRVCVKYSGTRT